MRPSYAIFRDSASKRPADDEVDDVQKRLRLMESDLAAIKPDLAAIKPDLAAIKPDLAAIKPDLAAIKPDLAAMKPKTLTEFTPMSVHEDEFRLGSLSMTRQRDDPIVMTPTLQEFRKGFGEFYSYYFVLREKVLFIRRLKEEDAGNAVVFLDGQKSYARLTNLLPSDLAAIRAQVPNSIVLVDGYPQNEADNISTGLLPFKLLARSCQFDANEDDNLRIVVLQAWRDADLLQYAELTNWVIETGLRKIKRQNTPFAKLVKEQYFYSGGSMREFCKEQSLLVERVARYCLSVDNQQAFELVYIYGGGQSKSQVDRLRRHYITDCSLEVDYRDSRRCFLSVDSGYVLSQLGRKNDMDKQLKVYTHVKSVGAGSMASHTNYCFTTQFVRRS
ncbi:unnamed protein product [Phytophthora lilii]|uniref:Unnamed protein product n=1 Tax=Phytophthora lilii TaxID=2077276 RepID=A0A9W6XI69_9STRA|nr:unnamed protein product [Phytophthora lilii]